MTNLNVTYDEMQSVSALLRTGQSDLESKLAELRGLVSQLVGAGFATSAASGAFDASYEQFTAGARTTIGSIESMAQFLDRAAQTLQETDARLAAQLGA